MNSESSSSFLLNYKKHNYANLERSLENHPSCLLTNIKHYIPLYQLYFSLNTTNYNSISLNHRYVLDQLHIDKHNTSTSDTLESRDEIEEQETLPTVYSASLSLSDNPQGEKVKKNIFLKFAPLIDPVKYMINKYKDVDIDVLRSIPSFENINNEKFKNLISYETNNTPYTDGFFTFLSSILLNEHNFLNGIDFYGSCLGTKKEFKYNIVDEIDYLIDSDCFHENLDKLYSFRNSAHREIFNANSRKNKSRLIIESPDSSNDVLLDEITDLTNVILSPVEDVHDSKIENVPSFIEAEELTEENLSIFTNSNLVNDTPAAAPVNACHANAKSCSSRNSSSVSSNSSNTTDDEEDMTNNEAEDDDSDASDASDEDEEYSTCSSSSDESEEEEIMCSLFDFPVEAIFMEKCDNTLDYLMMNNMLNDVEWNACLFQVITILSVYQKCFDFTHNDLHTNNIMFTQTDKQYLYYKINEITYKVPTFGRIFKIIDFGRAIYKFKGKLICSNSFHERGDAGSQYNFGPYYNSKKQEVLPNKSFDLCRLACCLYDYFIEDLEMEEEITRKNPIIKMVSSWLTDDKGRNILYKMNGEERYPEFKLYKMIARTIHSAIPEDQIKNEVFDFYKLSRNNVDKIKNKDKKIMNVDKFPSYIL